MIFLIPLISSITLDNETILNTTVSNSSMTFSVTVIVDSVKVNPTYIYLENVATPSGTCSYINHSISNSNLDSADFGCEGSVNNGNGNNGNGYTPGPFSWITYDVSDEQFKNGYTKELAVGTRLRIMIDGEYHYVGVVEIMDELVVINVSSITQQSTLAIEDTRRFEVTSDDYYDISVTLNSITDNKASITIISIDEEVTPKTEAEEKEKEEKAKQGSKVWIFLVCVIVFIFLLVLIFLTKRFFSHKNEQLTEISQEDISKEGHNI